MKKYAYTAQSLATLRVDREARRINGVAIISKSPDANGDAVDDVTLAAFADLGNAGTIRARYDHPNRANPDEVEQTLNNLLGKWINFRVDGDTTRADALFTGINAELENKVMDFAEKTPELFGVSVVFDDTPAPKGKKKTNKPQPCRPLAFFAGDFVDIPAANAAGLFAAKTAESSHTMDPIDVFAKDGKCYAMVDGKEYALNHTKEAMSLLKGDDDEEDDDDKKAEGKKKAAKRNAQTPPAEAITPEQLAAATAKAVEDERSYRKMFATVKKSANLEGEAAEHFENEFYGRSEADLKFLAKHAISNRTAAVGDNSGNPEQKEKKEPTADEKLEGEVAEYCTKRFAKDANMRRAYRVNTTNTEDAGYQTGLKRFMATEKRNRSEWSKPDKKSKDGIDLDADLETTDDPINKVLKNKSAFVKI